VLRTARILLLTLFGFFLVETLVFDTDFYAAKINPDSSTGGLELRLRNEIQRSVKDRDQVLAIGDSRMGFFPKYPNEMKPGTGYTYASIAMPGTTARCWYYMLRAVDPTARRYAAIVIGMNDFEDVDTWDDHADRIGDLRYVIARLRWSDLPEFSNSYRDPALKWQAARGILLKGLVYQTDFQDFLRNPSARLQFAEQARHDSASWYYDFVGTKDNVGNIRIDWSAKTVTAPSSFPANRVSEFRDVFVGPLPPQTGRKSPFMKYWLNKIHDFYRGSGTRIIFIRLPRGPFVRPDQPAVNPHSSVRELAAQPDVSLAPEHFLDSLEHPDIFTDPFHMNGPGCADFSRMVALQVRELLGPAGASR
jgi:hypothetical protein